MYTPPDKGSLTYERGRAGPEDSRIKTLFYLKLKTWTAIEDSDVVMRIEMHVF